MNIPDSKEKVRTSTMKYAFIFVLLIVPALLCQNILKIVIKDEKNGRPLIGVNVYIKALQIGTATDENGFGIIENIPDGRFTVQIDYVGYKSKKTTFTFPLKNQGATRVVYLAQEEMTARQVVVTATRNNGVVRDSPVRVEVLGQEEVNEEKFINPGNIAKLLGETTGIQVQQTSAISGNVSFRLEGLPGGYTQLLKDGFPAFSGFSSGLSLLQIPPLDLAQVEVLKGSLSTFYGEGALAGIINLVSKSPSVRPEWELLVNRTHRKGTDFSSYYSRKINRLGVTILVNQNMQRPVDVDGDQFTDIPRYNRTSLNPRLFYQFNKSTSMMLGFSASFENRKGGDISAVNNRGKTFHTYFEKNLTSRLISYLKLDKKMTGGSRLSLKNSVNHFIRRISFADAQFYGKQDYSYSEFTFSHQTKTHHFVEGLTLITDNFSSDAPTLNYDYQTIGLFAQDDWQIGSKFRAQPGIRLDYHSRFHLFLLPHLSLLYKIRSNLSVRMSGGLGYKAPDILNSVDDRTLSRNAIPPLPNLSAVKSKSINLDVSYIFFLKEFLFTLNQAAFYTRVDHALFSTAGNQSVELGNDSHSIIETKGLDTNLIISLDELSLFLDYSYNDLKKETIRRVSFLELSPKHKFNMTLSYEGEGSWRTGIEAFYTGHQYLPGNSLSRDYWTFGASFEKKLGRYSLIANVENIFDERQTKHERVVTPPFTDPGFRPIYEPLDGIVANVAVQVNLSSF